MQHLDPFENSSYRAADRRIPWIGVGAAGLLIAALTWIAGPDRASHAGIEHTRSAQGPLDVSPHGAVSANALRPDDIARAQPVSE